MFYSGWLSKNGDVAQGPGNEDPGGAARSILFLLDMVCKADTYMLIGWAALALQSPPASEPRTSQELEQE